MSKVVVTKWGNSAGIRISVADCHKANIHIGEALELEVNKKGELILKPLKKQQDGWFEAFNNASTQKDESVLPNLENEFDKDEWNW